MIQRLRGPARSLLHSTIGPAGIRGFVSLYDETIGRVHYALEADGKRSRTALSMMRDAHRGERCFIIGNGPSLKKMDLSPLRAEHTFGLNRAYLMFAELGFATSFLVAVNPYVIEQCAAELAAQRTMTFLTWQHRGFLPRTDGGVLLRLVHRPGFSHDLVSEGLWGGATVTFVALQLVFHFGFGEVVLVGVDHSFATKGAPNKLVTSSGDDPNHFDPSYFGKGFRWQLPDLDLSEVAYRMAKQHFEADGRRIFDATVDGKLDVFPKRPFASFFARKRSA